MTSNNNDVYCIQTQEVGVALKNKDYARALEGRGRCVGLVFKRTC
jgi:hypothetical protein